MSRHVFAKFSEVGLADFVASHVYVWPTVAAIVFESSWGRISLTGIETSAAPMPEVLNCLIRAVRVERSPGTGWLAPGR